MVKITLFTTNCIWSEQQQERKRRKGRFQSDGSGSTNPLKMPIDRDEITRINNQTRKKRDKSEEIPEEEIEIVCRRI